MSEKVLIIVDVWLDDDATYGTPAPRDDHWLATEFWVVALLHRRIKGVHIDVHDFAVRHAHHFIPRWLWRAVAGHRYGEQKANILV